MTDNKNDTQDSMTDTPCTADGIPLVVNGERLSDIAIQALREARDRKNQETSISQGRPREINGPKGMEPTRYGDWERDGRVIDF
ncbi:DUF1674 domain-containing protein [Parvularcula sp. IMCC14364]|uniref:DUF1674 domain-containing protein n=1 Tax=Parvularcula sp. IMCC14364 TaxID=3067902 RepID=UPI002741639E|nr:DUF1674 domain-containing protein [Parvularcula sp. IMCC14364]